MFLDQQLLKLGILQMQPVNARPLSSMINLDGKFPSCTCMPVSILMVDTMEEAAQYRWGS